MRRLRTLGGGQQDAGAVAVLTAIFAVVILVVAAFAVEVTNLYATDRASQRTVDLAAASAAQFLPDRCNAVNEAYRSLNDNPIPDTPAAPPLSTLLDGDPDNGEIQILLEFEEAPEPFGANATAARGAGAWVDASDCTEAARPTTAQAIDQADLAQGRPRLVRVMSPTAEVPFRLGQALTLNPVNANPGDVPDNLTSFRMATAGIVGSDRGRGYGLMPVAIPAGCIDELGYGPRTVITAPKSFPESIAFTPGGSNQGPTVETPAVAGEPESYAFDQAVVATGSVVVRLVVSEMYENPQTTPVGVVTFDFHTNDGTSTTRAPALTTPPNGVVGTLVAGTATSSGSGGNLRWRGTFDVVLPSTMSAPLGNWLVRAAQLEATGNANRRNFTNNLVRTADVFVDGEFYTGGDCDDPNQGNFGLIRSDRTDGSGGQLDRNIALGLDHTLTAFPSGVLPAPETPATVCPSDGVPEGALRDITPGGPVDGANCIAIEPGNMAGPVTRGLVTGTTGAGAVQGRLFRDTAWTPPDTAPASCESTASGPSNFLWRTPTQGSVSILNTVLSCYLAPGYDLQDVVDGTDGALIEDIYADPRFFFVPVLNGEERPPSAGNHYAIREFVGGFITGQEIDGTVDSCTGTKREPCNGIEFGSRQVFALTTFIFPASALPPQTAMPVQEGDDGFEDFIAGTKEIVLFE